jgi:hypothetical protein
MTPESDIYNVARKKILAKIKLDMGLFPKAMDELTSEQKTKVENFAERYEVEPSEIYKLVLKDENAFLAIAAKDPNRMGFYEAELRNYLLKQKVFINTVEILPKSGKGAHYLNNGLISSNKPAGVKSLDLKITLKNGTVIYVIHKYTRQSGGAQTSALTDVRNTLNQLGNKTAAGQDVYIASILDGDFYSKISPRSTVSKLEETKMLYPNVIVTTWVEFVKDSKKFFSELKQ